MGESTYRHLIFYDRQAQKLVIMRVMETGASHLYTEIALANLRPEQRTFEGLATILGRTLLLDIPGLRDWLD
jgi:hypothetical protein